MGKGLPYSTSRGHAQKQELIRRDIALDGKVVTVSATGSAVGFGSVVVEGLPEGNILLLGAVGNVGFAGSGSDDNLTDTWSGDFGLGTTPASDATISGADEDILPETAIGAAVSEVIAATRAVNATQAMLDNTANDLELNLNLLIDAANIADDESVDITLSGTLHLVYIVLGDD